MSRFPKKFDNEKFSDALQHFKFAIQTGNKYQLRIDQALTKYGDHGPLISGVVRDHFPKATKDLLRKLAREKAAHVEKGFAAKPPRVHDKTMTELYLAARDLYSRRRKNPVKKKRAKKVARKKNPQRVTNDWLNKRIGLVNDMLGLPATQYTEVANGLTGNRGHLFIDHAYGGVKVGVMVGDGTGEDNVSDGYVPKRELNTFIDGMIATARLLDRRKRGFNPVARKKTTRRKKATRKRNPGKIVQGMQLPNGRGRVLQYDRATDFVLVDRGAGVQPFVVWTINAETLDTYTGHYFKNLTDAVRKFEEKAGLKMNPRKKRVKKNAIKRDLWQVFKCKGNNLMFLMIPTPGSKAVHWSKDKRYGMAFAYKNLAERTARSLANKMGTSYAIGISDYDSTAAEIKKTCSGKA